MRQTFQLPISTAMLAVAEMFWIMVAEIAFVFLIAGTLAGMRDLRTKRRHWRATEGLCTTCGYSLAGNVSGVCPECGTPVDEPE